jgi:hypothetical protein
VEVETMLIKCGICQKHHVPTLRECPKPLKALLSSTQVFKLAPELGLCVGTDYGTLAPTAREDHNPDITVKAVGKAFDAEAITEDGQVFLELVRAVH